MPETFAGAGIEGEQAVGEEVVTDAIGAIKIKSGGTSGNVDDSSNRIERHSGPIVGGSAGFPGVTWPGFVAEFAGSRNGMKRPAKFAGADVEGANIARRSGKCFWIASTDDDQVFEDDSGAGENDGVGAGRFAAEIFAEINAAGVAKIRDGFAGGGV